MSSDGSPAEVVDESAGASPAEAADPSGADGPSMRCPKCDTEQPETVACRVCGLLAENMSEYRAEESDSGALTAAWVKLESAWDDEQAHEVFIQYVVARSELSAAAALYRPRARSGDPQAQAQLQRVANMAAALLTTGSGERSASGYGERDGEPYRNVALLLVVIVFLGILVGVWALTRPPAGTETETPPPLPGESLLHLSPRPEPLARVHHAPRTASLRASGARRAIPDR